jgi:hypothetical protein
LISLFPADLSALERKRIKGKIEKRSLGRTGEMLSMIGFGGIVVKDATTEEASSVVKLAIDTGINYFDVAPSYGNAEIMLGPALQPYRKNVFLACKTTKRTINDARTELEQSLENLRTDHFDLYQCHAVTTIQEVETIHGPGGALETFLEARKEGKIRFIGFSAHSVEAAMAMMDRFDFDTILFPVNYETWYKGNFGPQVLARAQDAERSKYPKCWYEPLTSPEDIRMGLRFTLSHPVTAAVPPGDAGLFRIALSLYDKITPLKKSEIQIIREKASVGNPLFSYQG